MYRSIVSKKMKRVDLRTDEAAANNNGEMERIMKYDFRVVAYIDILGFKNAIEKTKTDEKEFDRVLKTLTELKDFFIRPKDHYEIETDKKLSADTQILQVSDCLIISRLIQEQGGIFYMLSECAFAIHLLISNKFLCRGAIRFGKMYHNETTLFGPAYVEAYNAEKEEKLPVVKFDKDLFEIAKDFPGPANIGFEDWAIDFIKKNCKKLDNGEYYLDYFTDYDDRVGGGEGTALSHYLKLREIIVDGLNSKDKNVYKKCIWAAQQFNKTAKNYGLEIVEYKNSGAMEIPSISDISDRANIIHKQASGNEVVIYENHRTIINVLFHLKEKRKIQEPFDIIMFDNHDDFCNPNDATINKLMTFLENQTKEELHRIVEFDLNPLNNDWIKTGMELNLIDSVFLFNSNDSFESFVNNRKEYETQRFGKKYLYNLKDVWSALDWRGTLNDHTNKENVTTQVSPLFNH